MKNSIEDFIKNSFVERRNQWRYELSPQITAAIKACNKPIEVAKLLFSVEFKLNIKEIDEIFKRCKSDENFGDVIFDIENRK